MRILPYGEKHDQCTAVKNSQISTIQLHAINWYTLLQVSISLLKNIQPMYKHNKQTHVIKFPFFKRKTKISTKVHDNIRFSNKFSWRLKYRHCIPNIDSLKLSMSMIIHFIYWKESISSTISETWKRSGSNI